MCRHPVHLPKVKSHCTTTRAERRPDGTMSNASRAEITQEDRCVSASNRLPNRQNRATYSFEIQSTHHQIDPPRSTAAKPGRSSRLRVVPHGVEVVVLASACFHRTASPAQEPALAHHRLAECVTKATQAASLALDARHRLIIRVLATDHPILPRVRNGFYPRARLQGHSRGDQRSGMAELHGVWDAH